jgi:hypothetical protein
MQSTGKTTLPQHPVSYYRDSHHADVIGLLMQSPELQARLSVWIRENVSPAKRTYPSTSYGLKHNFSSDCGVYISNGVFKAAMLLAGYKPVDQGEQNWRYRIKVKADRAKWPATEHIEFLWHESVTDTAQQIDSLLTYWSELLVNNPNNIPLARQVGLYTQTLELLRGKELTYPDVYPIDMRLKARIIADVRHAEAMLYAA